MTALDYALHYAALGMRVIPIAPGTKHPAGIPGWQLAATTDPDTITAWWTGRHAGWGVGIATGPGSGVWALDIDVGPGKHGDDTLAALLAEHGELPDTVTALTPSGGRHILFAWDVGRPIRNDQSGRLGPGLDTRGDGGQILAAPTIHPNGHRYQWEDGHAPGEIQLATAPDWLHQLLEHAEHADRGRPATSPGTATVGDRPGDRWAATTTWDQLLTADGWTFAGTGPGGEQRWTRPGKEPRDGISATVDYAGAGLLKVFTSSIPELRADATYSRVGYEAAMRWGGDHSAFARHLASLERHDPPAAIPAWHPTQPATPAADMDVRWVNTLHDRMPPEPPILIDGMLRQGELCVIGAPRAIGKTWLGMNLASLLAAGAGDFLGTLPVRRPANVLYLQGELDRWGSATRWQMLHARRPLPPVAETFDRVRIRTVRQRRDIAGGTEEITTASIDERVERAIVDHGVDVIVLDPWATYFAGNENSNDETEAALDTLRDLTLRHGVTWVILHHLRKGGDLQTVEPEDMWRGASRLADWASTRVTILAHYTPSAAKAAGLPRHEARRYVDVHFLRRAEPTPDRHAHLGDDGWWEAWDPDERAGDIPEQVLSVLDILAADGGRWESMRAAAAATGLSHFRVDKLLRDAASRGLVCLDAPGARGASAITLTGLSTDDDVTDATVEHGSNDLQREEGTARRADRAIARSQNRADVSAGQTAFLTARSTDRAETDRAVAKMPPDLRKRTEEDDRATARPYRGGSPHRAVGDPNPQHHPLRRPGDLFADADADDQEPRT